MPTKRIESGPALTAEDVFRVAEIAQLVFEWTNNPYTFEAAQVARYRELCGYYGVDALFLLHAEQNRDRDRNTHNDLPTLQPPTFPHLDVTPNQTDAIH